MRRTILALTLAITTSGCAAMMKDAPDAKWTPSEAPRCSETNGGIALDIIFGLLHGAIAIAAVGAEEPAAALPFAGFSALHIWSAVSGNRATTRCKDAMEQHDDWLVDRENQLERSRRRDVRADAGDEPPDPNDKAPVEKPPSDDSEPVELADPYADEGAAFVDDDGHWKDFWREVKR